MRPQGPVFYKQPAPGQRKPGLLRMGVATGLEIVEKNDFFTIASILITLGGILFFGVGSILILLSY